VDCFVCTCVGVPYVFLIKLSYLSKKKLWLIWEFYLWFEQSLLFLPRTSKFTSTLTSYHFQFFFFKIFFSLTEWSFFNSSKIYSAINQHMFIFENNNRVYRLFNWYLKPQTCPQNHKNKSWSTMAQTFTWEKNPQKFLFCLNNPLILHADPSNKQIIESSKN
jgi:hypothetical protein